MILTLLISAVYELFSVLISPLLPNADVALVAKFTSTFDFFADSFISLAYYWLPMDAVRLFVTTIISAYVLSFTIKFALKIFPILSGGILKTDKL